MVKNSLKNTVSKKTYLFYFQVRTTLDPRGMDKLIVDHNGKAVISNDGATIMKVTFIYCSRLFYLFVPEASLYKNNKRPLGSVVKYCAVQKFNY